jgi:hypothetical protein
VRGRWSKTTTVLDTSAARPADLAKRAVAVIGPYKTERIRPVARAGTPITSSSPRSPGRLVQQPKAAGAGHIPPVEYEAAYYRAQGTPAEVVGLT